MEDKIVLKKPTENLEISEDQLTRKKITKNDELGEVNLDKVNPEKDVILDDYANINEADDSINEKNNATDIVKNNDVLNEKDNSKKLNNDKTKEQNLAFFNIQRPKKDIKKKISKKRNNYVGLLLP